MACRAEEQTRVAPLGGGFRGRSGAAEKHGAGGDALGGSGDAFLKSGQKGGQQEGL